MHIEETEILHDDGSRSIEARTTELGACAFDPDFMAGVVQQLISNLKKRAEDYRSLSGLWRHKDAPKWTFNPSDVVIEEITAEEVRCRYLLP